MTVSSSDSAFLQRVRVVHARLKPVRHEFSYALTFHLFSLDDLSSARTSSSWLGYNELRPFSIYDDDHLGGGGLPLRAKLLKLLAERGYCKPLKEVLLLTTSRYCGVRVFTPVSFYFCYGEDGILAYLVVEINNTFFERYVYVVEAAKGERGEYSATLKKDFHVSPFFGMDFDYRFRFFDVREKVDISIDLQSGNEVFFHSRVSASEERLPLSTEAHRREFFRAPLQPFLTTPRIYWHALQLVFRRRVPVLQKPNPSLSGTVRAEPVSLLDRGCLWFVRRFLRGVRQGALELVMPDGAREVYGDPTTGPVVRLQVRNFRLFRRLVLDGGLGLGEGFIEGDWDAPDLSAALRLLLNNWHALDEGRMHFFKPLRLVHLLFHKLRSNTVTGSKKNIQAHYDLSNDFFKLFLDESMTYSCGVYENQNASLADSQHRKISKILEKAQLEAADHVLEVGSGWGSLAMRASLDSGCRVTSVTVSEEQCKLATQRAAEAGLSDKVKFCLKDYRHVEGQFNKIISVEMLEAVGHEHLPAFFSMCEKVLAPDGLVVLQVITMPDQYYHEYRQRLDFIQKYVFPGSHLPSLSAINHAVTNFSSLVIESVENIGPHYARTLSEWRTKFEAAKEQLQSLGYDERFQRIWRYYFASCEAEFATRWISVQQIVLSRPNNPFLIRKDLRTIPN